MHCIATTVKEVKILTVNVPVGSLLILCLRVYIKGRGGHSHMNCSHNCDRWQIVTVLSKKECTCDVHVL